MLEPTTWPSVTGAQKGLVEQRTDPERLGRLRVRVVGVHGKEIPTKHLPWAYPRLSAWNGGGMFWIPPVGEYVWVTFENGDYEYPTWSGGWWGTEEAADGKTEETKHRDWPTSNFGGKKWPKEHPLALEKIDGVKEEDAPNNFTLITPLQKHLEMDDRRLREKIKLADELDNLLWINTERGVATLEASEGLRNPDQRKPRGLTLSSFVSTEEEPVEALQLYTSSHWYITVDDLKEVLDINTPGRHRIRVDDKLDRIEFWTHDGHHLILDQASRRIVMRTAQGRELRLDDEERSISLVSANRQAYLHFSEATGHMEFFNGEGTTSIKSVGDVNISSGGRLILEGAAGTYINSGYSDLTGTLPADTAPYQLPKDLEYRNPTTEEVSRKVPRAPDYPEAKDEEESEEGQEEGAQQP